MIKEHEVGTPSSCLNRAQRGEMLFVLLARDPASPVAIRAWIGERLRLGKNQPGDRQIIEAEAVVLEMERQYDRQHSAAEVGMGPKLVKKWDAETKEYRWVHPND